MITIYDYPVKSILELSDQVHITCEYNRVFIFHRTDGKVFTHTGHELTQVTLPAILVDVVALLNERGISLFVEEWDDVDGEDVPTPAPTPAPAPAPLVVRPKRRHRLPGIRFQTQRTRHIRQSYAARRNRFSRLYALMRDARQLRLATLMWPRSRSIKCRFRVWTKDYCNTPRHYR